MERQAARAWAISEGLIEQDATLEPLTGGLINELWRASSSQGSVIIKHTTPTMRDSPQIALDQHRGQLEREAMRAAQAWTTPQVRVPRVLGASSEASIFAMEDAGQLLDLSQWLLTSADLEAARAHGARLGEFLARLHAKSARDVASAASFRNDQIQRSRAQVQYRAVGGWCERAQLKISAAAAARAAALGEEFMQPGRCLIMGDLWPRSILVDQAHARLWIIDWEFAHWGQPEQDLAHLFAHLFMLKPSDKALSCWRELWLAWRAQAAALHSAALERRGVAHAAAEVLIRTIGAFGQSPSPQRDELALALEAISWLEDETLTLTALCERSLGA